MDRITQIRRSPMADGCSQCHVSFGRSIRTITPLLTEALDTNKFVKKARKKRQELYLKQQTRYNRSAKNLKLLDKGANVLVKNPETRRLDGGAVIQDRDRERTYIVSYRMVM